MAFEKIQSHKKSAYVIDQILKAIQNGEYGNGEKLPSERQVAREMGVSRPSVREAYSALQIVGIIDSKSGDGTYVKDTGNYLTLGGRALQILREHEDPYEIWEAREVIETGLTELMVKNITAKEIKQMEEIIDRMRKSLGNSNYDEFFESDHDFHLTIGKAAHNQYIEDTIASLVNVMRQELWQKMNLQYYLRKEKNAKKSLQMHEAIFENIKRRNTEKLKSSLRKHYRELRKHLSE